MRILYVRDGIAYVTARERQMMDTLYLKLSSIISGAILPLKSKQESNVHSVIESNTSCHIYNLRGKEATSDRFYNALECFSKEVMDQINSTAENILHQYAYFVTEDLHEKPRSTGEYAVEFLTLGITWKRYCGASQQSLKPVLGILRLLYLFRQKHTQLKPFIDPIRGKISSWFLINHISKSARNQAGFNHKTFEKLIQWLDATGEFKDEVKRFLNWKKFLYTLSPEEADDCLDKAVQTEKWFESHAQEILANYTTGVSEFLRIIHPSYRGREDELFCGKNEIEYFVNMVASEIMNQGLRSDFAKTMARVVLVPGCMRAQSAELCKARKEGNNIECIGCTKECNVFRIEQLGKIENFKTYIIPHSSGFTQWLKRWENSTEHGVIAIACPLNITVGGYEMRELNIPSQCVMLDYCGCKKHWNTQGIATDVNDTQIMKLVRL
jgi:hypothetical protein